MSADDVSSSFAAYLDFARVTAHLTSENGGPLVAAILDRPNSIETVHHLLAVAIYSRVLEERAQEANHPRIASQINEWRMTLEEIVRARWRNLNGVVYPNDLPLPEVDADSILVEFMRDRELMGILGLQVGWAPDLKRIAPDRDLKGFDPGGLS